MAPIIQFKFEDDHEITRNLISIIKPLVIVPRDSEIQKAQTINGEKGYKFEFETKERSIIDDLARTYPEYKDQYHEHFKKRFGKTRTINKTPISNDLQNKKIPAQKEIFNPNKNKYLIFMSENGDLEYAINIHFIKGEFGYQILETEPLKTSLGAVPKSILYQPKTIINILTGNENSKIILKNIKPYISVQEEMALIENQIINGLLNSMNKKRTLNNGFSPYKVCGVTLPKEYYH